MRNISININAPVKWIIYLYMMMSLPFLYSCKKDWLDSKRNKSDLVPKTLKDFQGILDKTEVMNLTPEIASVGIDNFYLTYTDWQGLGSMSERNAYIWAEDIFNGETSFDWNYAYRTVEHSNIVLEGLEDVSPDGNEATFNNVKGQALFFRAKAFFDLVSFFAKPYNAATAAADKGIPIRMTTDVNVKSVRSSVEASYAQIINDLKQAETLLPVASSLQTRPSKVASMALLARVYLNMEKYDMALKYADDALDLYSTLLDFNSIAPGFFPFPAFPTNKEVIFYTRSMGYASLSPYYSYVDTLLYQSYDVNDLRKTLFYIDNGTGRMVFDGSYTAGLGYNFGGLAVNELYLIRAECYARTSQKTEAMDDLNTLLSKRYKNGTFVPVMATDADEALDIILEERRKELPFTINIRWNDLRRLNKDPRFAKTLVRKLNGQEYTLPPNDNRYVLPIPPDEIRLSNIEQNPR